MSDKTPLDVLNRVLDLPEKDRAALLHSPAVTGAVETLTAALPDDDGGDIEVRRALGRWHELAGMSTEGKQRARHEQQAMILLLPVYLAEPERVPARVATAWKERADTAQHQAITAHQRYDQGEPGVDLDEMVNSFRTAHQLTPNDSPDHAMYLSALGQALHTRFEQTGQLADLDEAIQAGRDAITATPPNHPDHATVLSNLGLALHTRFKRTGQLADLDEAIQAERDAITATPPNHPERTDQLSNLAAMLRVRFERAGQATDLDEAIRLGRTAIASTPTNHPDRARRLSNLGAALQTRYEQTGQIADLDEAIQTAQSAVAATPPDHPDHAKPLSNLAGALRVRFMRTGQVADLDEAIQLGRAAVASTPSDRPDGAGPLSNLGVALQTRYEQTGQIADLDETIQTAQSAVAATPPDHPDRAMYLSNLGVALQARYEQTGQIADLDEAIQTAQSAVAATPPDHPSHAKRLSNLGAAFRTRFEHIGHADDLDEAVVCFREASTSPVAPPRIACAAAHKWGRLVSGSETLEPFTTALALLPRITPRWLGYTDLVGQAKSITGLGRDAAAAFIDAGDHERAVTAIEQATAITYSLISQSRTDLTELHDQNPALAARLQTALDTLNQNTETIEPADDGPATAETMMRTRQAAAADLDDALHQVRALGGTWGGFFLPPAIHDLTATAPGPVATVVVAARRCDALITTSSGVHHVPLPELREDDAITNANRFLTATHTLSNRYATAQDQDTAEQDMIDVCDWLWHTVAEPILNHLGLTNPPGHDHYEKWPRLWWILTGTHPRRRTTHPPRHHRHRPSHLLLHPHHPNPHPPPPQRHGRAGRDSIARRDATHPATKHPIRTRTHPRPARRNPRTTTCRRPPHTHPHHPTHPRPHRPTRTNPRGPAPPPPPRILGPPRLPRHHRPHQPHQLDPASHRPPATPLHRPRPHHHHH